jgi:hypothetical protein
MTEPTTDVSEIRLARCQATCRICGVTKNQIDGTRERAEQVVREAIERHVAEAHPSCAECGHIHTLDGCTGPPTPSDQWAGVSPSACDCPTYPPEPTAGGRDE